MEWLTFFSSIGPLVSSAWGKLSGTTRFVIVALVGLFLVALVYVISSSVIIGGLRDEVRKQEKSLQELKQTLDFQKQAHAHQIAVLRSEKREMQIRFDLAKLATQKAKTQREHQEAEAKKKVLASEAAKVKADLTKQKAAHAKEREKLKGLNPEEQIEKLKEYYKKWRQ